MKLMALLPQRNRLLVQPPDTSIGKLLVFLHTFSQRNEDMMRAYHKARPEDEPNRALK